MKQKNKVKRLAGRLKNWNDTMAGAWPQETKVKLRRDAGGYHKPGSNKR